MNRGPIEGGGRLCDVRDYGAVGDGVADDSAAFREADAAADGRLIMVPKGIYRITEPLVVRRPVVIAGRIVAPDDVPIVFAGALNLSTYAVAFGSLVSGLRRGLQALMTDDAPDTFDMADLNVQLSEPLVIPAPLKMTPRSRILRNGTIRAEASEHWETPCARVDDRQNASLRTPAECCTGTDITAGQAPKTDMRGTLSEPAFANEGGLKDHDVAQHRYLLDLTGCTTLESLEITDVNFDCAGLASGVVLPDNAANVRFRGCHFTRPRHRAITASGAQHRNLTVKRCIFTGAEDTVPAADRRTVAISAGGPDVTIRDCRMTHFRHAAVISGPGALVADSHIDQSDGSLDSDISPGIVLTRAACNATITTCRFASASVLWTDNLDGDDGAPFSGLTLVGNVFTCVSAHPESAFVVIAPTHPARGLANLAVTGNMFRACELGIARAERVGSGNAALDLSKACSVTFEGNTFRNVARPAASPLRVSHRQEVHADTWVVETDGRLPFGGPASSVGSLVFTSRIRNEGENSEWAMPYVSPANGEADGKVHVIFPERVRGDIEVTIRLD